jgi:hypothetical protein
MFLRKLLVTSALSVFLTGTIFAQSSEVQRSAIISLSVDKGSRLEVVLTEKLRAKLNEPVHGKIVDPVYAFDREVIPSGTEILGKVTGLRPVGKWKRLSSMLAGDFTPLHVPEITFDTLVLADGKRIPIKTSVLSRGNLLVRFNKGQSQAFTTSIQQPGGDELIHSLLWGLLPYHPQFVPTGTSYKATLLEPLDFGKLMIGNRTLAGIGSEPEAGSLIYARLMTALDSKKTKAGTPVQAVLAYPLYSSDHRLIFPAGSRLQGEVAETHAGGFWNRGGELAIKFTSIEPPITIMWSMSQMRQIEGRLVGVQVPLDFDQLRIDKDGMTQVARTKQRFLAPAFAVAGATPMLLGGSTSFGTAFAEAYGSTTFSRVLGGSAGLGLPGGVAGLMVPPVGIGLGAYSVGYAIYFNILGRGKNIVLPVDTSIEIRVDRPMTTSPRTSQGR